MTANLGPEVPGWSPRPVPRDLMLEGRFARAEALNPAAHATALWAVYREAEATLWDYMPYGPYADGDEFTVWLGGLEKAYADTWFQVFTDLETGRVGGMGSFLRVKPRQGSIEVGHLNFAPPLQRTRAATEAMALMMGWAFDAGYRRYEWKCNALNLGSRRAAQRLGLSYEGVFRQADVVKGRNRDTAWFAAVDAEWPALRTAFESWLDAGNFDAEGRQRIALSTLTRPVLVALDPALDQTAAT